MSDPNAPASSEAFRLIVLEFLSMTYHVPDREHKAGNLGGQGEMFPIGNIFAEQAQKAVPSTRSGTSLKSGSYRSPDPIEPDGHERCSGGGAHSPSSESFSPSSRNATLVSSTFCGETPSAGATSTRSVSFRPAVAANFESTFV